MMALTGYNEAKIRTGESSQLPKGGYVVKIADCREVSGDKNGRHYSYLAFSFDVCEGEYTGHFTRAYNQSTDENKKWKGTYNFFIPQEGSIYYEDNLSKFKTMISYFEDDNDGWKWDWDEKKLKEKIIGIIYAEKEFMTADGEVIIITEPRFFTSTEKIRNGTYKIPALKRLNGENTPPPASASVGTAFDNFTSADDAKLPWEV